MRKIGAGSFGTALLCRCADAPREMVVMKRVLIKDMSDEERRGARREAEILRHLEHPGILRFIEAFENDGHLCLVAEHCERGDLTKLLADRRGVLLPEAAVLDYMAQILLALLYVSRVWRGG